MFKFITLLMVLALTAVPAYAVDGNEILARVEKKPYGFGGFLQAQPTLSGLDRDSPLYRWRFYNHYNQYP